MIPSRRVSKKPRAIQTFRGEPLPKEWQWELGPIERVYLVGAGASVHYGLPTLKRLAWELVESLDNTDRDILLTAIRESFPGIEMTSAEQSVDYEELLNRLNPDALAYLEMAGVSPPDSPRRRAALLALQGLHDYVLDRCQRVAHQIGPFDVLVKALDSRSVIVSFNWDVLLELAVLRAGREYSYLPPGLTPNGVLLLKPHGSINWFALLDRELLSIDRGSNLWVIGPNIGSYMATSSHRSILSTSLGRAWSTFSRELLRSCLRLRQGCSMLAGSRAMDLSRMVMT